MRRHRGLPGAALPLCMLAAAGLGALAALYPLRFVLAAALLGAAALRGAARPRRGPNLEARRTAHRERLVQQ